jgi:hypothetical protein
MAPANVRKSRIKNGTLLEVKIAFRIGVMALLLFET